jgi:4-hydroxybenzoate polyprenyltransferase
MSRIPPAARAWLELARAPNLLTLPGQVLAGAALAGGLGATPWPVGRLCAAVLAGAGFYLFGLFGNDAADVEADRRERPGRPLPSGRISVRAARIAARLCAGIGLLCAAAAGREAGAIGLVLLLFVTLYNSGLKNRMGAGEAVLGICRSLLLLLGAVTVAPLRALPPPVWAGAGLLGLYVSAVSVLARDEVGDAPMSRPRRAIPLAAALVGIGLLILSAPGVPAARGLLPGLMIVGVPTVFFLKSGGFAVSRAREIGALLGHLIPIQIALILWTGVNAPRLSTALILAACWAMIPLLSRRFAAS